MGKVVYQSSEMKEMNQTLSSAKANISMVLEVSKETARRYFESKKSFLWVFKRKRWCELSSWDSPTETFISCTIGDTHAGRIITYVNQYHIDDVLKLLRDAKASHVILDSYGHERLRSYLLAAKWFTDEFTEEYVKYMKSFNTDTCKFEYEMKVQLS